MSRLKTDASDTGELRDSTPSRTAAVKCPVKIVYKRYATTGNALYDYGVDINQVPYGWTPDVLHKTSDEHAGEMSRERIILKRRNALDS